ncbi:hypothetical protein DNJ73_06055 [Prochlorococcus marinus XMU1408]|uniref:Uncharacterized protein n=1 Tax=Prochlorococcus marinus XMU1408 TaxID=2213228 RepID=A0A318R3T4_PROMR|nr:hypothetical protein [Prochlorococcus marinus str. XMU1408]PYE01643.1 hypothetical protein DNJ73_06055 [Prochlorococcus marinus XMU1408]
MFYRLFLTSMMTLLILEVSNPLEYKAEHKNNLINKFCIASLKSKFKFENKEKLEEISHFTCKCFFEKYSSGSSIKNSRIFCRDKTTEEFNL